MLLGLGHRIEGRTSVFICDPVFDRHDSVHACNYIKYIISLQKRPWGLRGRERGLPRNWIPGRIDHTHRNTVIIINGTGIPNYTQFFFQGSLKCDTIVIVGKNAYTVIKERCVLCVPLRSL